MKLAPLLVATALFLGKGNAHADELLDPYPADTYADPAPPVAAPQLQRQRPMHELRRLLVERFDRNHDGRLEPRERRHAMRALRRLERKLARQGGRGQDGRGARLRKLIYKYDLNGDGNVEPGEMPPEMARRLRHLDRNGDGWVDSDDFR